MADRPRFRQEPLSYYPMTYEGGESLPLVWLTPEHYGGNPHFGGKRGAGVPLRLCPMLSGSASCSTEHDTITCACVFKWQRANALRYSVRSGGPVS